MIKQKILVGAMVAAIAGIPLNALADFQFRFPSSVQFKTGVPVEQEPTTPAVSPEEALEAWLGFVTDNGLTYGADWSSIAWQGTSLNYKDLSGLPTEPYPNNTPGSISIRYANVGSLAGFAYVTSIGANLEIMNSTIGSVDGGFSRLASVGGSINMYVDVPLPKLAMVGGALVFTGPTFAVFPKLRSVNYLAAIGLVDASSLAQLESVNTLLLPQGISSQPGFVPIPKSSWICQAAGESLFQNSNYASQSEACGDGPGE